MRTLPTRQRYLAAAWAVLALGVSGAFMIARRSDASSPIVSAKERASRVFKTKNRKAEFYNAPGSSAEFVRALADRRSSLERDQALIHAVGQWAHEAPVDAMAWIRDFPQGELHDCLACATVIAIADHNPQEAISVLETEIPDGPSRNHAIVAVAQRWVQQSPTEVREWLDSLTPTPAKNDALREISLIEVELARPLQSE